MKVFGDTTFIEEHSVFRQMATSNLLRFHSTTLPQSNPMTENDLRWEEVIAATTQEQWERLERMFCENESKGTTPLDFTNR